MSYFKIALLVVALCEVARSETTCTNMTGVLVEPTKIFNQNDQWFLAATLSPYDHQISIKILNIADNQLEVERTNDTNIHKIKVDFLNHDNLVAYYNEKLGWAFSIRFLFADENKFCFFKCKDYIDEVDVMRCYSRDKDSFSSVSESINQSDLKLKKTQIILDGQTPPPKPK